MPNDEWVVYSESAVALKLTKSGKGLWCRFDDGTTDCVPVSQISARSMVQEPGELGTLIVSRWWASKPRVRLAGSNVDPDHRLKVISDQTKQPVDLAKLKCVWCGLKNFAHYVRCYCCARNFRTGELTDWGAVSPKPPYVEPHQKNKDYRGK